ncbi:E3 ubiquitin ligase family protein [Streptomonospora sp. S1-112]|uniref:RING-type E3 ubiquitin transferase n=1 Tax=Streptomonospora mangrovi TaxID=2883123 RepID=A0A9X3NNI4_9ACTN|nr:GIDE domain-containing protein [Streptomonospora mangrovi]MDA0565044.1 E3 ubiquitin ligase family protein [Streptomonospora mangrovi]
MLVIIGVALLLGALVLAPLAVRALRRWSHQRDLEQVRPRAFARRVGGLVTVSGVAVPGPAGPIESRLARHDCVWHGHEVLRHYWSLTQDAATGERVRVRDCDSIADYASTERFGIVADPERPRDPMPLLVEPEDAALKGADLCLQRVVGRPQRGVPAPADDLLPRVKGRISGLFRGETIEFEYREWIIRPGEPVVVTGRLELREGHPVITAPQDGRLRIEHGHPAEEPPAADRANALLLCGGALVSACAGLLLTLAGA